LQLVLFQPTHSPDQVPFPRRIIFSGALRSWYAPGLKAVDQTEVQMKMKIVTRLRESAKVGKIALLWFIGIPLPIAILIVYLGGCN
jgi:hypothetical protein